MSRVVAIVQARMGSSRFPGKMLAQLGAYPLLEWVLRRVSWAQMIDDVVLATSDADRDDALVECAKQHNVGIYRGSEFDVLGRFAAAGESFRADTVVRVCADNPFIDPGEIDRLIITYNRCICDYAFNHQDRRDSRYADGFGAEVLSNELLQKISAAATDVRHREHATLFLWENQNRYRIHSVRAPLGLAYPNLRFDVDQPKDLAALELLLAQGITIESSAAEIVRVALRSKHLVGGVEL